MKTSTSGSGRKTTAKTPPRFSLTERDAEALMAICTYRALVPQQVEQILGFNPTYVNGVRKTHSNCERRLRLLTQHGYLIRTEQMMGRTGRRPLVYWLSPHGAAEVALARGVSMSELDWRPRQHEVGQLFLDHVLSCNDFRISVTLAAKRLGVQLVEWLDDTMLRREYASDKVTILNKEGKPEQAFLVPDSYVVLNEAGDIRRAAVEVDRRTVTGASEISGQHDWQRKIAVYQAWFQRGGLHEKRYGTHAGRVLVITTGQRRLENLKRITERVLEEQGEKQAARYWFTTADQVTPDSVISQPIWAVSCRQGLFSLLKPT